MCPVQMVSTTKLSFLVLERVQNLGVDSHYFWSSKDSIPGLPPLTGKATVVLGVSFAQAFEIQLPSLHVGFHVAFPQSVCSLSVLQGHGWTLDLCQ